MHFLKVLILFFIYKVSSYVQYHITKQDHFDGLNTNVWYQEYFVNDTYFNLDKNPSSPIFLCVGGEGPPLDNSVVIRSIHCNDAVEMLEDTGALMLALQHRYYGCISNSTACPVTSLDKPEDYKFLSSKQALSDIVLFHQHIIKIFSN